MEQGGKTKKWLWISAPAAILIVGCFFVTMGPDILSNQPSDITPISKKEKNVNHQTVVNGDLLQLKPVVEQQEYNIQFNSEKNIHQSPNRTNNIRAFYQPGKWRLQNRLDSIGTPHWNITITTMGVYADGKCIALPKTNAKASASDNHLEFDHSLFKEQYINDASGVRQNFVIAAVEHRPKEVTVKLGLHGMHATQKNSDEIIFTQGNNNTLTYSGLKAWDACGEPIAAQMRLSKDKKYISLSAITENATFPITIDPIVASGSPANANSTVKSNQSGAFLGTSLAGVGDINGDGYSDVVVGAPLYDNGQADEGAAFLYLGAATGINTVAAVLLEANQSFAKFGISVAGAGDVNGDGYSDVIVGANFFDNGGIADAGAAFIYYGSSGGITAVPDVTLKSSNASDVFGISVSGAGDVNGDGYSDVVIGADSYDNGQIDEGATFVYYGSVAGISSATNEATANAFLQSNQGGAYFGHSVSGAGDLNADGYSDIIAGGYFYDNGATGDAGMVYICLGSAAGISSTPSTTLIASQVSGLFGISVSGTGDINGDGYSDVIVGADSYDNGQSNEGVAFIYHGSSSGIASSTTALNYNAFLESNQANAYFAHSVSEAGDVNGDGYNDVIVGSGYFDNGVNIDAGAAFVYQGSATGIVTTAASTIQSSQGASLLGIAVSGAGDVNGDGYSDVIVGAYNYSVSLSGEGLAFVYHGSASSVSNATLNTTPTFSTGGLAAGNNMGYNVSNAGDVNGDGYDDVIVGAPLTGGSNKGAFYLYYGSSTGITGAGSYSVSGTNTGVSNCFLGYSVKGAGDVNGDGYSDVIVGAHRYNTGSGDNGRAFVYYGASGGLNTGLAASTLSITNTGASEPVYPGPAI